MKKLFLIAFLAAGMVAGAQDQITINISQDAKLAFIGDDKGNDAYTLDILIRSEWQGKERPLGYYFVYPEFEIAELQGGTYRRYTVGYGRTFYLDKLFAVDFLENFKGTFSIGYGILDYNGGYTSFDFTSQMSYDLGFVEVFISWQIAERKDLVIYGDRYRGSGSVGIKLNI